MYFVLLFAPWAFGTTEPWSLTAVQVLTALACVLQLAAVACGSAAGRERSVWSWWWGVPMVAVAVYIGLQAANASHHYQAADQSLVPQAHVRWLPHTVDAAITWQSVGRYLTYVALFWTVRVAFASTAQRSALLRTLVVSGFVMAVLGILQDLSATQRLFWIRLPQTSTAFFGPFVNPNNYAAYMNLLIPVALFNGRRVHRSRAGAEQKSHPGYLFYFIAAVMIASVILSKSRAGIALCVGLVSGWLLLEWLSARSHGGARPLLACAGLLVVVSAGLLLFSGVGRIQDGLVTTQSLADDWRGARAIPYGATFEMFLDHWLFGIGAGGFQYAFPYYQPESLSDFWRYAHNDWLQSLAELGIAGVVLLAAFALGTLRQPGRSESHARTLKLCLVALGMHAFIDFPLHIAGITTLAVTFFALLATPSAGTAGSARQRFRFEPNQPSL